MSVVDFDAIVVGVGFGGIYMCKRLVDQVLSVKVIEAALMLEEPGIGTGIQAQCRGKFPGIRSYRPKTDHFNKRSMLYRYSWDIEDLREYPWDCEYLKQPDVLAYLQHVVERHSLRQYMQFNSEIKRPPGTKARPGGRFCSLNPGANSRVDVLLPLLGFFPNITTLISRA